MENSYRMTRKVCALAAFLAAGFTAQAADRDLVAGLNRFSDALYGQTAKDGGNVVFSPYSISAVLSMALGGARGTTAEEMRRVLGQPNDPQHHEQLGALLEQLRKTANTGGNQFTSANSLWVQKSFPILPEFTGLLGRAYHAAPSPADFENAPEEARAAINQWVDRETHGRIKDLFAPGAIPSDTRLVLGSAVYFNGKWQHPFRRSDTRPDDFTTGSGAKAKVPFMNRTGPFGYASTASGQTLEMRYAGTDLAFDILLPREGATLRQVESDVAQGKLSAWLGGLKDTNVKAAVPRFNIAYEAKLRPALEAMGMRAAFRNSADFSGIDDKRDLKVSQVVHKAWVDVTEEGAEAAAATGGTMALVSMRIPSEPVFRADRPFVFLIRDTKTGLILFVGRLLNP